MMGFDSGSEFRKNLFKPNTDSFRSGTSVTKDEHRLVPLYELGQFFHQASAGISSRRIWLFANRREDLDNLLTLNFGFADQTISVRPNQKFCHSFQRSNRRREADSTKR